MKLVGLVMGLVALLGWQPLVYEAGIVEARLEILLLSSEVGRKFLTVRGCPRLVEGGEIRERVGFKMVRICDPNSVSMRYDVIHLDLATGEILIGVDDAAKVVNGESEQRRMVAEVKKMMRSDEELQRRLDLMGARHGLKGRLQLRGTQGKPMFRNVIYVSAAGQRLRQFEIHVLTGELFEADYWNRADLGAL